VRPGVALQVLDAERCVADVPGRLADLREHVDEDVGDGDATREGEPAVPREAVQHPETAAEEVDGRESDRDANGDEVGRRRRCVSAHRADVARTVG